MKWPFFIRWFLVNRELDAIKKEVERHSLTAQEREDVRRFALGQMEFLPSVKRLYDTRFAELEGTVEMQFLSEYFNVCPDYVQLTLLREDIVG